VVASKSTSLEEHRTYSPHVGSRAKIAATGLLGGHVFERAHTLLAPPRGRAMLRSSTFASSRSETILDGLRSRYIALPLCHGSFRALCRRAGQAAQEDNRTGLAAATSDFRSGGGIRTLDTPLRGITDESFTVVPDRLLNPLPKPNSQKGRYRLFIVVCGGLVY
jgi:hypothetical protein